jgi:ABC-2 type transport system ATP-binding protein
MLCGILSPTQGSANVLGYDLITESEKIKPQIGYMSQKFSLYEELTPYENLDFYSGIYGIPRSQKRARIKEMLTMARLIGRENEKVANLSRGLKQRLALGCSIISHPLLLFLDEPTSGVSPTSRRAFFNIIQELSHQGSTVIVTTHFMDEAERCDRIAFFSEGKLLAHDTPDNLKKTVLQGFLAEVTPPDPMRAMPVVQTYPFVKECMVHGSQLHVLVEHPQDINLLQAKFGYPAVPIDPSLEDVFIALSRRKRKET